MPPCSSKVPVPPSHWPNGPRIAHHGVLRGPAPKTPPKPPGPQSCGTPSRTATHLLVCSRCAAGLLRTPSPGQRSTPPSAQSASFRHHPSPWSCRVQSRSPAHLFAYDRCNMDPRRPSFARLQLLQIPPDQPSSPPDPQPTHRSPARRPTQPPGRPQNRNTDPKSPQTAGHPVLIKVPGGREPERRARRLKGCPPNENPRAKDPYLRKRRIHYTIHTTHYTLNTTCSTHYTLHTIH